MKGLVYRLADNCVLKIDGHALTKLRTHAQHERRAPEAGGVLLGRWLADGLGFVVDDITEPLPEDRRTRSSFFRSGPGHMRAIEASLRDSGDTRGYLGEWHTHPEPSPTPSAVDLRDWRRRLRDDEVELPWVFFVIVGTVECGVWVGNRQQRRLTQLECSISDASARPLRVAHHGG